MNKIGMVGMEGIERYRAIEGEQKAFSKEVKECYKRGDIERVREICMQCEALRAEQDSLRGDIQKGLWDTMKEGVQ